MGCNMILNLKQLYQIVGERVEIKYQIEKDSLSDYQHLDFSTPISIEGKIENRAGIVTLSYSVDFTLNHNCDRCLCEFSRDYSFKFEHMVVRSLNTDNDDYIVTNGDKLDLNELVLSDLLLQLPSKILCNNECKGLCSICGADLNESECNCEGN